MKREKCKIDNTHFNKMFWKNRKKGQVIESREKDNIQELIDILLKVKERFTDKSDFLWTSYETSKEIRNELDICIEQLNKGDTNCLEKLNICFLPTSTFQEHSLQNNWAKEYMKLSEKFDHLYTNIKDHSR